MQIAIPLYDRFTALDAVGPYEVLSRIPGADLKFVATEAGPYKTDNGMLTILAEASLDDMPRPDILCVPGGWGTREAMSDERLVGWIRDVHETTQWTTSVCTGSLLLGAAGILDGLDATSHWLELETLRDLGANPTERRVVEQGKVITSAGVSSGIDMALTLLAKISGDEFAQTIQLLIEYDPQPPFDSGSHQQGAAADRAADPGPRGRAPARLEKGPALAAVGRDLVDDLVARHQVQGVEPLAQLPCLGVTEVDAVADRQAARRHRPSTGVCTSPAPSKRSRCRPAGRWGEGTRLGSPTPDARYPPPSTVAIDGAGLRTTGIANIAAGRRLNEL